MTPTERTQKVVNESYWIENEYSLDQFAIKTNTPTCYIFEYIMLGVCKSFNCCWQDACKATHSGREKYYARVIMYILIYKKLSQLRRVKTKESMKELIGLDNYKLVLKYYEGII
jgi:hypothetical protein